MNLHADLTPIGIGIDHEFNLVSFDGWCVCVNGISLRFLTWGHVNPQHFEHLWFTEITVIYGNYNNLRKFWYISHCQCFEHLDRRMFLSSPEER